MSTFKCCHLVISIKRLSQKKLVYFENEIHSKTLILLFKVKQ